MCDTLYVEGGVTGLDKKSEASTHECDASIDRVANGNVGKAKTPTQAQSHVPYVIGEVRDWLDGIIQLDMDFDDQVFSEPVVWVCRFFVELKRLGSPGHYRKMAKRTSYRDRRGACCLKSGRSMAKLGDAGVE